MARQATGDRPRSCRLPGVDRTSLALSQTSESGNLIGPTIAVHKGRVVKRTGDGVIVEFRSVVDAVRCAIEVQNSMIERNTGLPPERCIEFSRWHSSW